MPKPKFQRADAFDQTKPAPLAAEPRTAPYINANDMNSAVYENGASSFPMSGFEDPVEKENEALKGQLSQAEENAARLHQEAEQLRQQLEAQSSGIVIQDGGLSIQGFHFSPTGLIAPEHVDQTAWQQVGMLLFRLEGSIQWLIGDWLAYGEDVKWGQLGEIAEFFGREVQTLSNYTTVARKIQFSRRRENLSFSHHSEVMGLREGQQEEALNYAEQTRIALKPFRKWLKDTYGERMLALPRNETVAPIYSALEKFTQRDPSTYKAKDKETILDYVSQMRRWLDDIEAKAK